MKVVVLILLVLGGIFSLHEYKAYQNDKTIATRGIHTVARVIDISDKRVRGLAALFERRKVVKLDFYTLTNNKKELHSVEKHFDTVPSHIQLGKDIEVVYDPLNLSLVYLPGQKVFGLGGVFLAASLLLLGLGLFIKMLITGEAFDSLPDQYEEEDEEDGHVRR